MQDDQDEDDADEGDAEDDEEEEEEEEIEGFDPLAAVRHRAVQDDEEEEEEEVPSVAAMMASRQQLQLRMASQQIQQHQRKGSRPATGRQSKRGTSGFT